MKNGIIGTGRRHGSLTLAGKVRMMTPKIAKQNKKKNPRGRAGKRRKYNMSMNQHKSVARVCGRKVPNRNNDF